MIIEHLWGSLYNLILLKLEGFLGVELSQDWIDFADELTDEVFEIIQGQLPSEKTIERVLREHLEGKMDNDDLLQWFKDEFILRREDKD